MNKASKEYEVEMATLGFQKTQAYLGDVQSAREQQTRLQESEQAGWLAKNVHSMLAIIIIGLTFILYWSLIFGDSELIKNEKMKDIVIYILGALTTVSTQVAAYYFGSSQGSADKNKALASLRSKGGS